MGERQYSASLLHSHDTDIRATMNMAVGDGVIAAGQDGTCCLMTFKLHTQKEGHVAPKNGKFYYCYLKITCSSTKELKRWIVVVEGCGLICDGSINS